MNTLPDVDSMVKVACEAQKRMNEESARKEARRKAELEKRIQEETDRFLPGVIENIKKAAARGALETSIPFDRADHESESIYNIASIIRKAGYKVFTRYDSVNYGDSAAPCIRDRIILDILWK